MKQHLDILLIEDDPGDVDMTMEVLEMNNLKIDIRVAENGQIALDYLQGDRAGEYKPDLILLDLNMPVMNGWETLREIKDHKEMLDIPVIILTTSESDDDISYAYMNGASCYITKPRGIEQYSMVMSALENFWLSCVKYPPKN